jgi:hypothetical protein
MAELKSSDGLRGVMQHMARNRKARACWDEYAETFTNLLKLIEQDESIILALALRPQVVVKFDAGPERLDLLKN